jgi:hypothetical protein
MVQSALESGSTLLREFAGERVAVGGHAGRGYGAHRANIVIGAPDAHDAKRRTCHCLFPPLFFTPLVAERMSLVVG